MDAPTAAADDQLTRAGLGVKVSQHVHKTARAAASTVISFSDDFTALKGGLARLQSGRAATVTTAHYSAANSHSPDIMDDPLAMTQSAVSQLQSLGESAANMQGTHLPGM